MPSNTALLPVSRSAISSGRVNNHPAVRAITGTTTPSLLPHRRGHGQNDGRVVEVTAKFVQSFPAHEQFAVPSSSRRTGHQPARFPLAIRRWPGRAGVDGDVGAGPVAGRRCAQRHIASSAESEAGDSIVHGRGGESSGYI